MQKHLHVFFQKLSSTLQIVFSFVSAKKPPSKKASTFGGGCRWCCCGRCCCRLVIAWATQKTSLKTRTIRFLVAVLCCWMVVQFLWLWKGFHLQGGLHTWWSWWRGQPSSWSSRRCWNNRGGRLTVNLHYLLSCLGTANKKLTSQQTTTLGGGRCRGGGRGGRSREEEGEQGLEKAESEMNQVSLNLWWEWTRKGINHFIAFLAIWVDF